MIDIDVDIQTDRQVAAITRCTVKFGDTVVVDDISVAFERGQFTVVVGPNGAGKSTLLRLLAGEIEPAQGTVDRPKGLRCALVGDSPLLYDVLTPGEHLDFFARFWGVDVDIEECLDRYRLTHLRRSFGRDLSLGERQRLTFALVSVGNPQLLLLDEPFNGLDRDTTHLLLADLDDRVAAGGSVVVVTHTPQVVQDSARRLLVVRNGQVAGDPWCSGSTLMDLIAEVESR